MCDGDAGNDRESVRGSKLERARVFQWKIPKSPRQKKTKSAEQSQENIHNFLLLKGTVHKESNLEAQTFNSAYYCEVVR
jgi:hypothetical protein